jgi:hypothetical protein
MRCKHFNRFLLYYIDIRAVIQLLVRFPIVSILNMLFQPLTFKSSIKTKLSFVIILTFYCAGAAAQVMPVLEVPVVVDSVKRKRPPIEAPREKHFGRAAFQTGVSLLTPWLYDKFAVNKDYADINLASMGRNLKPSAWEWIEILFKQTSLAILIMAVYTLLRSGQTAITFGNQYPAL